MIQASGGVGLSLHLDQIDQVLSTRPKFSHVELIADNFLSPGPHHKKLLQLAEHYDILFHCVNGNLAGIDPIDEDYWRKIKTLAETFNARHVSDHLCFQAHEGVYFHDLLPFPFTEESLHHVRTRVDHIQELLCDSIVIENLSYYLEFEESDIRESEFLNQLHHRCGSGVLLDLNNIWVNQQNLGINSKDYVKDFDSQAIKEIHLAGPEIQDDIYVDTHGTNVKAEALEVLRELHNWGDVPIIYERDRNIPPWQDHLRDLEQINDALEALC